MCSFPSTFTGGFLAFSFFFFFPRPLLSLVGSHWLFSFTFFWVTACDFLCQQPLQLHSILPGYTSWTKGVVGCCRRWLRLLQMKESCFSQEGAVGCEQKRSWGKAALRTASTCQWRLLCGAANESRYSERNLNAEYQHVLSLVPSLFPVEVVCAALPCLPTLWFWKQSPATAPNTGLLKMNIHAWLYLNFPKALCSLDLLEQHQPQKNKSLQVNNSFLDQLCSPETLNVWWLLYYNPGVH